MTILYNPDRREGRALDRTSNAQVPPDKGRGVIRRAVRLEERKTDNYEKLTILKELGIREIPKKYKYMKNYHGTVMFYSEEYFEKHSADEVRERVEHNEVIFND